MPDEGVINPTESQDSLFSSNPTGDTGQTDVMTGEDVGQQQQAQQKSGIDLDAEVPITYRGDTIPVPLKKLVNHYQLRHDLQENQAAFKQEKAQWEAEKQRYEEASRLYDKYHAVDQHAVQNPDWWQHVSEAYNNRGSFTGDEEISPQIANTLNQVTQTLESMNQKIQSFESKFSEVEVKEEEKLIDQEYTSLKKEFEFFDFESPDESGLTPKTRILKHGADHGFPTFKAAFFDLYGNQLIKTAKEGAMKETTEAIKKSKQAGVINVGATAGPTEAKVNTRQSWDEMTEKLKQEYGVI